ncbi:hypothetical protein [Cupriavidus basilensis]|nr:hypothetical protein [Cupriavidus basilensis]
MLRGGRAAARRFLDRLTPVMQAVSVGAGVEDATDLLAAIAQALP